MITKTQAKVGLRVKYQSLDLTLKPEYGIITKITNEGCALIKCDDGENSDTYLDSGASCWYVA